MVKLLTIWEQITAEISNIIYNNESMSVFFLYINAVFVLIVVLKGSFLFCFVFLKGYSSISRSYPWMTGGGRTPFL